MSVRTSLRMRASMRTCRASMANWHRSIFPTMSARHEPVLSPLSNWDISILPNRYSRLPKARYTQQCIGPHSPKRSSIRIGSHRCHSSRRSPVNIRSHWCHRASEERLRSSSMTVRTSQNIVSSGTDVPHVPDWPVAPRQPVVSGSPIMWRRHGKLWYSAVLWRPFGFRWPVEISLSCPPAIFQLLYRSMADRVWIRRNVASPRSRGNSRPPRKRIMFPVAGDVIFSLSHVSVWSRVLLSLNARGDTVLFNCLKVSSDMGI